MIKTMASYWTTILSVTSNKTVIFFYTVPSGRFSGNSCKLNSAIILLTGNARVAEWLHVDASTEKSFLREVVF